MGIGFFLANATIERMGGKIRILHEKTDKKKDDRKDHKKRGTSIEVLLPHCSETDSIED